MYPIRRFIFIAFILLPVAVGAQGIRWAPDGNSYYRLEKNEIFKYDLPDQKKTLVISAAQLTPKNANEPLRVGNYVFSEDQKKLLIFTNTKRVWRLHTRGDYWVLDLNDNSLKQLGASRPSSSLMFAKLSPDGKHAAYVSEYNIYVEDLGTGNIKPLTKGGDRKFIYGTFDWVYEEEFFCRDGFRWSPDSKSIAFWQLDARKTKDFYLINNTDSIYSRVIPIEYPKVGEDPSACKIGVVNIDTGIIKWMEIPGDPVQNYLVRIDYIPNTTDFIVQQINRKQNESKLYRCNSNSGAVTLVTADKDEAWVDVEAVHPENSYSIDFTYKLNWLSKGQEFIWSSEKDGWAHLYKISADGKKQQLITKGDFDVIALKRVDEATGFVYYMASPANPTQRYLYRSRLDGKGTPERVTPSGFSGVHNYTLSPNCKFSQHTFSNANTPRLAEWISLPDHKAVSPTESIQAQLSKLTVTNTTEFFKVKTADGIEMDGWMVKPENFDPSKKYPIVFYGYTEPGSTTITDSYGISNNFLYNGDMRKDGYLYVSVDNRGTPMPKGREWRKSIYRKIGLLNIYDQAMAAKEILKWPFVDSSRVAVWGWSGGGNATLGLLFQYPEIYKTGIAISSVTNQLTYDNIYQERYMGLPQENRDDFVKGSPITYAKNLKGKLLYIHGTGDDNVHYANAEMLLNELIRYNKQFQFMAYPNRTHGISEGEGTDEHLSTLYTNFLRANCPPGGR